MEKTLFEGRRLQVTCGRRYGGKSRERCKEKSGFWVFDYLTKRLFSLSRKRNRIVRIKEK